LLIAAATLNNAKPELTVIQGLGSRAEPNVMSTLILTRPAFRVALSRKRDKSLKPGYPLPSTDTNEGCWINQNKDGVHIRVYAYDVGHGFENTGSINFNIPAAHLVQQRISQFFQRYHK